MQHQGIRISASTKLNILHTRSLPYIRHHTHPHTHPRTRAHGSTGMSWLLVSCCRPPRKHLVLSQAHEEVSLRSSVLYFLAGRRSSASTSTGSSYSCSVCFFSPHPPALYYKCAYTKATRKTEGLGTGAASAAASVAPAAAPTDDALLSLLTGTGPELQQVLTTRFEALGFQTKSSSPIRSSCSWQCCYYLFCLPPPRPGPAGNTATTSLLLPCTDKQ